MPEEGSSDGNFRFMEEDDQITCVPPAYFPRKQTETELRPLRRIHQTSSEGPPPYGFALFTHTFISFCRNLQPQIGIWRRQERALTNGPKPFTSFPPDAASIINCRVMKFSPEQPLFCFLLLFLDRRPKISGLSSNCGN